MKDDTLLAAETAKLGDGLHGARFVVRGHDRNQHGIWPEAGLERFHGDEAIGGDRQKCNVETLASSEVFTGLQNGGMFDLARDDVSAPVAQQAGRSQHGEVGALGTAAGKHHFARFAFPGAGDAIPGVVEEGPGVSTDMVHTRRVAVDIAEEREHRVADRRIQRRGRVVVEIDGPHRAAI